MLFDELSPYVRWIRKSEISFWKQLFAYLNDSHYNIDNSIAERFIRPLVGERKNSLFFAASRVANVSASYHTLLSTCRMNGLSALEYLKNFLQEAVSGRRDYENLLPIMIGLCTIKNHVQILKYLIEKR